MQILDALVSTLDDRRFGYVSGGSFGGYPFFSGRDLVACIHSQGSKLESSGHGDLGVGGFVGLG